MREMEWTLPKVENVRVKLVVERKGERLPMNRRGMCWGGDGGVVVDSLILLVFFVGG